VSDDTDLRSAQRQRRERVFHLHRQALDDAFGPGGKWLRPDEREPGLRERLCHAVPFLVGDEPAAAVGNALVRAARPRRCEFASMHALQLLLRCGERLEPATVSFLEEYLAGHVEDFHDHIHSFWGMNWNQVCIGTFTLLAGGELLGRPDLVRAGLDNLLQAREVLVTNGFTSEYCSSTYSPIAAGALQEIVNLVRDEEAVALARPVLARVWLEMACFWHPPTCALGGPQSRAYAPDSLGLPHHLHLLLWQVFGERALVEDLAGYFYEGTEYTRLLRYFDVEGTPSFFQHGVVSTCLPDYDVPDGIEELLFHKTYPFRATGTVELAEESVFEVLRTPDNDLLRRRLSQVHWPCQRAQLRTYQTEDYALASSTGWWMDGGQSDQFTYCGRRAEQVDDWADRTTVYARYLINDRQMAGSHTYPFSGGKGEGKHTRQEGHAFTAQHDDLLLYGCQPKRFERREITRLRLAVVLPVAVSGLPDEVWYGDEPVAGFDAAFEDERPVYLRWGRSFLALQPLIGANWGRRHAVTFGMENGQGVISLLNYEGAARDFEEAEIVEALNGFAARAGSAADGSFEKFRERALAGRIVDRYYMFVRRLRYVEPGLQLALEYSPNSLQYKQVSTNGRQEMPVRFAATGVKMERFPYFEDEVEVDSDEYADWFERIGKREREYYHLV